MICTSSFASKLNVTLKFNPLLQFNKQGLSSSFFHKKFIITLAATSRFSNFFWDKVKSVLNFKSPVQTKIDVKINIEMLLKIVPPPNTSPYPLPKKKLEEGGKPKRKGKKIIQKEVRPIAPYPKGQLPMAIFTGNWWDNNETTHLN